MKDVYVVQCNTRGFEVLKVFSDFDTAKKFQAFWNGGNNATLTETKLLD